jgi:biotin carboxylase
MRTVVFVVPYAAEASFRFAKAFAELKGVRLIGLMQKAPPSGHPFAGVVKVADAFDPQQIIEGAEKIRKKFGGLHQIIGVLEPLQVPLAQARKHFGLPGTDPKTADLFRDKARMKDALRAAGLPCARHKVITSLADALTFVKQVGFPIVLKPPAGAGCKATWRINSLDELNGAIHAVRPSVQDPTLAEEFLRGREFCFDTITVKGKICFENVSRYYPGPLEVTENPWIQWAVVQPRALTPDLDDARAIGRKAIKALGLGTGFTHMEWFRRDDGSVAIGEIAARPPGANFVEMMGFGHDFDMYRAWARAITDNAFDGPFDAEWRGKASVKTWRLRGSAEA